MEVWIMEIKGTKKSVRLVFDSQEELRGYKNSVQGQIAIRGAIEEPIVWNMMQKEKSK